MRDFHFKKQIILVGLAILLLIDGAFVYFNLQMSTPRENRQRMQAAQARQLALVRADVKRATEIREKIPEVLKELDQFEGTLLTTSKGYSELSQEMDVYGRETHLVIEDKRFHEKMMAGRDLTEVTVEATVLGEYNGVVSFLNRLQRSKNVYIVDALDVDSEGNAQVPVGTLRVNLHLRTYFRKV